MSIITATFLAFLYSLEFSSIFNKTFSNCEIEFSSKACNYADNDCDWHGYADMRNHKIILSYNHWLELPNAHRKELVFHELGHCVFEVGHPQDKNIPNIMRPQIYSTDVDGSNWSELIDRMKAYIRDY